MRGEGEEIAWRSRAAARIFLARRYLDRMRSTTLRGTTWVALAVLAANVTMCVLWTPLAWGLRGSSYEDGRPNPEDELVMAIGWALLAIAVVVNVVVPVAGAVGRRWAIPLGVVVAWAATPVAYALAIAGLAAYASTQP